MKIILRDDIEAIAKKTAFSYREVYVLHLFEDISHIEEILQILTVSGMGVGMYLLQKGVPQDTVWRLLHDEAEYVKEDDADGDSEQRRKEEIPLGIQGFPAEGGTVKSRD